MSNFDKKEAILQAANDVFMTTGFEKSTVQEIAQKAGVGKGTIYEYFESKEDLFVQMIQSEVTYIFDDFHRIFGNAQTIEELIDGYIESTLMLVKKHTNKVHLLFDDLAKVSKDVQDWFVEKKMEVMGQLTTVIEKLIDKGELRPMDAEVAAWMIMDIIRLGFFYKIFHETVDIKPLLQAQKDIILKGSLPRSQ